MAYNLREFFASANMTLPKLPLPSTAKNSKSARPTLEGTCCFLGEGAVKSVEDFSCFAFGDEGIRALEDWD